METRFGGQWTLQKLEILRRYLDAYTTVLRDQPFRLIYVDAFAGEGSYLARSGFEEEFYGDLRDLRAGSPQIALDIGKRPFDRLVFIEKDIDRCRTLEDLGEGFPDRSIEVWNDDANDALPEFCDAIGSYDRAVVFLDPFATQVSWSTVEKLAATGKIDCWILFPLMAITRMMPKNSVPPESLAVQLDRIFGGREFWEDFYSVSSQQQLPLFAGEPSQERLRGSDQIALRYRERLDSVFTRVAPTSRRFRNSKNSPLFELFFAASNRGGAVRGIPIVNYILENW